MVLYFTGCTTQLVIIFYVFKCQNITHCIDPISIKYSLLIVVQLLVHNQNEEPCWYQLSSGHQVQSYNVRYLNHCIYNVYTVRDFLSNVHYVIFF